jgi:hypothetical protein
LDVQITWRVHFRRRVAICGFLAVTALTAALSGRAIQAQHLVLRNPLGVERHDEVIEIPLTQVLNQLRISVEQARALVAEGGDGGRVPIQLYGDNPEAAPDTLLVLANISPRGEERLAFHVDHQAGRPEALVFGREAPERKDDFAWENTLVTYRVYGPALQATGEITSGIDVWSKRVPNFVIDSFYKRDLEGSRTDNPSLSYHVDSGVGLDSYYVGPTRGCGGTAVFANRKLIVSKNYTKMKVLADGPIRFAFELSYAPWDANGVSVSETKRITLDAGTHLNKIESTYTFERKGTMTLAAGLAVHDGAKAEFPSGSSVASVWDTPQTPSAGRIATGMIALPEQHAQAEAAAGHALLLFSRRSGEPFTYYAGSGWSKADMPTAEAWNLYLTTELQKLTHPIRTRWTR